MPISNLMIQRRRLHELYELTLEKDLELFSVESRGNLYFGPRTDYAHEFFNIHARKITPENANRLKDLGFTIESVEPMNDYTLIVKVHKSPPEKKK